AMVEKYFGGWKQGTSVPSVPPDKGGSGEPTYVHIPWQTDTLPWVVIAFRGPAFSASDPRHAATKLALDVYFGETSELYKHLVTHEQKADTLVASLPDAVDPGLVIIAARLKKVSDALAVRDAFLGTVAEARSALVPVARLQAAKSAARYGYASRLNSSASIAAHLARTIAFERRVGTVNEYFRTMLGVSSEQVRDAARGVFTDETMLIATLTHEQVNPAIGRPAKLNSLEPTRRERGTVDLLLRTTSLPIIDMEVTFDVGSAQDPKGKEGLATLTASMIADAGSRESRIDEIKTKLYPMAAGLSVQVDKEITAIVASAHVDVWPAFADVIFPMITAPGFRYEDFTRLRDAQLAGLTQDLRDSNEEELGKERLQANVLKGTPYAHPSLGTVAGLKAISLDDVKAFAAKHYTRTEMVVGVAGNASDTMIERVRTELAKLPQGERAPALKITPPDAKGLAIDIVAKSTRATSISMGHSIDVTRGHPDFVALYLARTWLGEHRSTMAHLFQTMREERGLNYGDYAYIEAFPGGMFRLFPTPNRPRRKQLFEVWIRPVQPKNAAFALHAALYAIDKLVANGMTQEQLDATRTYLMKNVFVMAARQDEQLGYALDSRWFGIPEFTQYMRDGLAGLTLEKVNTAVKRHIRPNDMRVVIVTKDAGGLKATLQKDEPSAIAYDTIKSDATLAEDAVINARKLNPASVTVTPVSEVFAR
ncbi:MAG: insulinase family protein, partial [Clostridia bacterium]|nr:insulinase family protein [Deltaproteobacteria bacterium]